MALIQRCIDENQLRVSRLREESADLGDLRIAQNTVCSVGIFSVELQNF